jgi:hypothetical protein
MSLRNRIYPVNEETSEKVEFKGKKGVWRRVANHNIFFPDDNSDPIGIPAKKDPQQAHKEVQKTMKKVDFFNRLRDRLDKKVEDARSMRDDLLGEARQRGYVESRNWQDLARQELSKKLNIDFGDRDTADSGFLRKHRDEVIEIQKHGGPQQPAWQIFRDKEALDKLGEPWMKDANIIRLKDGLAVKMEDCETGLRRRQYLGESGNRYYAVTFSESGGGEIVKAASHMDALKKVDPVLRYAYSEGGSEWPEYDKFTVVMKNAKGKYKFEKSHEESFIRKHGKLGYKDIPLWDEKAGDVMHFFTKGMEQYLLVYPVSDEMAASIK